MNTFHAYAPARHSGIRAKVHIAPLSCGHRACPQCGAAQARQWEARRVSKLLPVPHFLVTLTLPEELRAALRACPRHGYGAMFRAAATAMRQSAEESKLGGAPGWTAVLHTWTRQLGHHPHLHLIVAGCALDGDGALRVAWPDYLVPSDLLAARWRDALAEELTAAAESDPRLRELLAEVPARTWARRWNPDIQPVGSGMAGSSSILALPVKLGPRSIGTGLAFLLGR